MTEAIVGRVASKAFVQRPNAHVHIAHAVHDLGLGGAQQVIKTLVAHGDKTAFAHTVYAGDTGVFHADVMAAGASVRILNRHLPKLDPIWIARLAVAMRRDRINLLHTHLFGDSLHGIIAARLAGNLPVVVTLHNSLQDFTPAQRLGYKWMLPRAARVVACSRSAGQSFHELTEHVTIEAIPNGLAACSVPSVTETTIRSAREKMRIPSTALVVGALGRMVTQKGFRFLVSAFQILNEQTDLDLRLVLLGTGPEEGRLRRQVIDAGLTDRVSFLGFRSDARELMVGFDVLVLSSLYEGLPITLLEGMASRRCIVASAVPGIADVVTDGEDGILAPARDPTALANALCHVLGDPDLRRRLADAAHATFRAQYTVERMVKRYEDMYRDILAQHSAPSNSERR